MTRNFKDLKTPRIQIDNNPSKKFKQKHGTRRVSKPSAAVSIGREEAWRRLIAEMPDMRLRTQDCLAVYFHERLIDKLK
ncbi:hypothetical protein CEXT_253461 [Caerostris extrusa]|uniref:Uncharacterized protein n=1 Tax=Caerostris extrusa TaxID=172846 RepID=A0AAV4N5F2_CAEEX|nr:hypothetical protein CEXT_253461 [Caerostris extrusa]